MTTTMGKFLEFARREGLGCRWYRAEVVAGGAAAAIEGEEGEAVRFLLLEVWPSQEGGFKKCPKVVVFPPKGGFRLFCEEWLGPLFHREGPLPEP